MQSGIAEMEIALRVLTALVRKCEPDTFDVERLRELADPKHQEMDLDQMACGVVEDALRNRAEIRSRLER